ncbi:hypothetical protein [Hydrogenophaga sp.]|uniref:hypothetical protein n=1 Tax=Hydrogenophaga sp. TaxID=1904254 RepID=UPI0035B148D7
MSTDHVEDVSVPGQPPLAAPTEGTQWSQQWSPAMSRPDNLPRITQRLTMPPGVAVRIRHLVEDVIVR